MTDRGKPDEQSVGRGAAGRVVLEVNVDWRRPGQRVPFGRQVVLVLSATVLVLERTAMPQPTFDHERLDVYRLSIDFVAFSYGIAKGLTGMNRPARDQWLRAAQSIPLNIAEGNGKQSLKDKNRFFNTQDIVDRRTFEC